MTRHHRPEISEPDATREAAGGLVLLLAAVVAMAWATSPWREGYHDLWSRPLGIGMGGLDHVGHLTLRGWVNEGLMTVFFLAVGLEIKAQIIHGELRDPRNVALPALAAVGGMIAPALVYASFNAGGSGADGWGIPMATDIAFAMGVLALVGPRVPPAARVFLLTLAVVDDVGAIAVIAIFYSEGPSAGWLACAVGCLGAVALMKRARVRSVVPYLMIGAVAWLALLESGVHATLVGVALGLLTPAHPSGSGDTSISPLDRLERTLAPWVAFLVLPLFALANAGVTVTSDMVSGALSNDVTLGVGLGLLVGKLAGVLGASAFAIRCGLARLPLGTSWRHMVGLALCAGIGFTVALFITDISLDDPAAVDAAKLGILVASGVAGTLGYLVLRTSQRGAQRGRPVPSPG